MKMEVKMTHDYSQFKMLEENRHLDRKHIDKIKASIEKYGYVTQNPILVDKDKNIIDGQHRFIACKEMGLPIRYEVLEEVPNRLLIELNTTQKSWRAEDYVNYWAQKGYTSYKLLRSLMKETGQSVEVCSLLLSKTIGGHNSRSIREGIFSTNNEKLIEARGKWAAILHTVSISKLPLTSRVVRALVSLQQNKNFKWTTLYKKIERQSDRIYKCSTSEGYEEMLKAIYNNRNTNPII